MKVWQAQAHQFGPGKRHIVDNEDVSKTLCGSAIAMLGRR